MLVSQLEKSSVVGTTLDLLQWLMGSGAGGPSSVGIGVSKAITNALNELHSTEKSVENTDQLMVCLHILKVFIISSNTMLWKTVCYPVSPFSDIG